MPTGPQAQPQPQQPAVTPQFAGPFAVQPPPSPPDYAAARPQETSSGALTSLRTMFQKKIGYLTQSADQQWSVIGDKLLREPEEPIQRSKQLSRLVLRFGVPDSIRAAFWMNMSHATEHGVAGKGEYWHTVNVIFAKQQHAQWAENAGQEKTEDMKKLERTLAQIEADVVRVSSYDQFFTTAEGCDQMRRLLTVSSQRNSDVGYCQTMYPIAVMLLTKLPEEEAFWMFETLVKYTVPPEYFTEDMKGLLVDVEVMNRLAHQRLPDLMDDLDSEGVDIKVFLTNWFPVMFLGCVNERVGDRIIDLVVYKGFKVIFRITLGILSILSDEIEVFDEERARSSASNAAAGQAAAGGPQRAESQANKVKSSTEASYETRQGFIMSTLQNLPKLLTEAELMEHTFAYRVTKGEIEDLRKVVRNEMEASAPASPPASPPASAPASAPVKPSPAASPESPKQSKPPNSPDTRIVPPPSLPAQVAQALTISPLPSPTSSAPQPNPPPSLPPEAVPISVQVSSPSQPVPSPTAAVFPSVSNSPPSSAQLPRRDPPPESSSRVISLPPNLTVIPQTAEPVIFDPLLNPPV